MNPISDVTNYLSNMPIAQRLLFEKRHLAKTSYGQKGLIQAIEQDGKVKFRVRSFTGDQIFDSVQDAIYQASSFGMTEIADINYPGQVTPATYNDFAAILKQIQKKTGKTLSARIAIHESESSEEVLKFLSESTRSGAGLTFPTKDGAIAVNYFMNGQALTTKQILDVLEEAEMGIFEAGELEKALREGPKGISKLFEKIAKRSKGILSPREVSLADNLLDQFLAPLKLDSNLTLSEKLAKATLNVDLQFEEVALAFQDDTQYKIRYAASSQKQRDVLDVVRDVSTRQSSEKSVKNLMQEMIDSEVEYKQIGQDFESRFRSFINDIANSGQIDAETGQYGINIAKEKLGKSSEFSDVEKKFIKSFFSEIEKGNDGSIIMNRRLTSNLRKKLIEERANLVKQKDTKNIQRITELDAQIRELSEKMTQVTVRGFMDIGGRSVSEKSAAMVEDFAAPFAGKYAMIAPLSTIKIELGMAKGVPILNLSGAAEASTRVYLDPMMASFHRNIFGREEEQQMFSKYSARVQAEFQEILETGRLNEDHEIMKAMKIALSKDTDLIPEERQFSKLLNRDYMARIMEIHRSGMRVNDFPEVVNMIRSFYDSQVYRTKGGMMMPIAPEVYRFAINSEKVLRGSTAMRKMLSGDPEMLNIDLESGGSKYIKASKFRIYNHNILMHEDDIRKFFHALGGFDLDDKGLPILGTYMSNGKKKLAAAMLRQPTAKGESIGLLRFDDLGTYQELFSKNKFFLQTMQEMMQGPESLKDIQLEDLQMLKYALEADVEKAGTAFDMERIEQATISVWEKLYGNGARKFDEKYLSSFSKEALEGLSLTELLAKGDKDPLMRSVAYTRLMADVKPLDVSQDTLQAVKDYVDNAKYSELENILATKGQDDFYAAITGLSDEVQRKTMSSAYLAAALKNKQENANILGLYANRSSVVGSTLFEIEELLKSNKLSPDIIEKLQKAGAIAAILPGDVTVDMTQNLTSGRMALKFMESIGSTDADAVSVAKVLKDIFGGEEVNLQQAGEGILTAQGRMIGVISEDIKSKDLQRSFIDEFYISGGKLKTNDINIITQGILESKRFLGADEKEIAMLEQALRENKAEEALRALGYIGKGTLSKGQETIQEFKAGMQFIQSSQMSRLISEEQRLAEYITNESRVAAETILDRNKGLIDTIQELMDSEKIGFEAEIDKYKIDVYKTNVATNILKDLEDVSSRMGIGGLELISALEYVSAQRKYKPGFLSKLPDYTMEEDSPANLLHRYMVMAQRKRAYNQQLKNIDLRNFIEGLNFTDRHRAAMIDDSIKFDFVDGFFSSNGQQYGRSEVIEDLIRGRKAEGASVTEQQIANAVTTKLGYEQAAIEDKKAFDFVNGATASKKVVTSADEVADDIPDVVSETLRNLSTEKAPVKTTPFQRLTKDYILDKFGKPKVASVLIGTGLLIAGSFMYQGSKDRTTEDASGPPLLPGGSAYEKDYPTRSYDINSIGPQGYFPGINYKVSLYGNRDEVEKFRQAAAGLSNASISSTMYNRIPDVTANPYDQIARSY